MHGLDGAADPDRTRSVPGSPGSVSLLEELDACPRPEDRVGLDCDVFRSPVVVFLPGRRDPDGVGVCRISSREEDLLGEAEDPRLSDPAGGGSAYEIPSGPG